MAYAVGMDGESGPVRRAPAPKRVSPSSFSKVGGAIAPVQNYSPPAYTAPSYYAPQNYAPPAQQSFAPSNVPATPEAAPQSKPIISEKDWLAGDGEYQTQIGQFDGALKDFLDRLSVQRSDFTSDYNTAVTGLGRNRGKAELGLGEDFTSRGLANSGLFAQAGKEMGEAFETQNKGLTNAKTRAESDFTFQERDKRKSTDQAKGNAKLASLGRMSMSQSF